MNSMLVYPAGATEACQYAAGALNEAGIPLVDHPTPEVTHLLLDVPSFDAEGKLRGGGDPEYLLSTLPRNVTVVGGNLSHPVLEGHKAVDLLTDPEYLACNAAITAECALQAASARMKTTFRDADALILGWGRIGKCLAQLLKGLGSRVTVAARKAKDRAMLKALGFHAIGMEDIGDAVRASSLVFNTVPELLLDSAQVTSNSRCLFVDLASRPGVQGDGVLWARGLPGIYAPESSGRLIGRTFLRLYKEGLA